MSASLGDRHHVAADGGALHEALVLHRIIVSRAMQDGAIVPDNHVTFAPGMGQDEFRLLRPLHQFVEQRLAGLLGPADDVAGMGADIERAPTSPSSACRMPGARAT